MAYTNVSGRLPYEKASKLGHLDVVKSEWVRSLLEDFEEVEISSQSDEVLKWDELELDNKNCIEDIWVVDGSFSKINSSSIGRLTRPVKEIAFIKTALLKLDLKKINNIDPINPHPLKLKSIMDKCAIRHSTVLPLKNVKTNKGSNYDAVRYIIYESIKIDENGVFLETLKWILYKKWNDKYENSPGFKCPHCKHIIKEGLKYNLEKSICKLCNNEVLITDILGFHLDMDEEFAQDKVVSSYMSIMEHLMLFTPIRLLWDYKDKSIISKTLFIKDGPLSLSSQYTKLAHNIREFISYSVINKRPIYILGCEKSGTIFEHMIDIIRYSKSIKDNNILYKILTHGYIDKQIKRINSRTGAYGERGNWGEKILVKVDETTSLVINIPVKSYRKESNAPAENDIVGLNMILNTIPNIISRKYEGALLPVELANGIASLSNYPSAKILEQYTQSI